jgi:hypothetical protein
VSVIFFRHAHPGLRSAMGERLSFAVIEQQSPYPKKQAMT